MKALCTYSKKNLLHNLNVIKAELKNAHPRDTHKVKIMAIIKSNAYGHGCIPVSKILDKEVDAFGIILIEDALKLRDEGISKPIVLLEGVFNRRELEMAAEYGFHVVFHDDDHIDWLYENPLPRKLHAWLKIDTGMGRLGFSLENADEAMRKLKNNSSIYERSIRIMSHFACADNPEHSLNNVQIKEFRKFIKKYDDCEKCFCNSAGIFAFPKMHYDWVRPGIALYGGNPFPVNSTSPLASALENKLKSQLKPVMTFKTKLYKIKEKTTDGQNAGGYGAGSLCSKGMRVGIVPVGYSHGYPRSTQNGRVVRINNTNCRMISQVMMDMMLVDLSDCPDAQVDNDIILWGDGLPIEDVAGDSGRISYDLLCGVGVDHHNKIVYSWDDTSSKLTRNKSQATKETYLIKPDI